MIEVEIKVRVDEDLNSVEEKLKALNAKLIDIVEERDYYIDLNPCIDLKSMDSALRVRVSRSLLRNTISNELTFKGRRVSEYPKTRKEITVYIDSAEKMLMIFNELGFKKFYTVSKTRRIYQLRNCRIFLDSVDGLGSFVEIEVTSYRDVDEAKKEVENLLKELGIRGEIVRETYLELLLKQKREG